METNIFWKPIAWWPSLLLTIGSLGFTRLVTATAVLSDSNPMRNLFATALPATVCGLCHAGFIQPIAKQVPAADIVQDRFHVSKYFNEGLDKVRRQEHKELLAEGDETLKGDAATVVV